MQPALLLRISCRNRAPCSTNKSVFVRRTVGSESQLSAGSSRRFYSRSPFNRTPSTSAESAPVAQMTSMSSLSKLGLGVGLGAAVAAAIAMSQDSKLEAEGSPQAAPITSSQSQSGPARYDLLPAISDAELNKLPIFKQMEYFVQKLQNEICQAVDAVEGKPSFHEDRYVRPSGGIGITRVITGQNIEKGAVNVSIVEAVPMAKATVQYLAEEHTELAKYLKDTPELRMSVASISLILHPRNPFAPTVHLNVRYFEVLEKDASGEFKNIGAWWFGGGTDLTPHYLFEEDCKHFHSTLKTACDQHDPKLYPAHKKWCDDYFYIKHRKEERGIGGVFYEDMHDRDAKSVLEYTKSVGSAFVPAYIPIVKRRKDNPFTEANRRWQEVRHGRYVEFNLMYDKGTQYGLKNPSARVESILVSLPLTVRYEYNHNPEPGTEEAKLQEVIVKARDWA